MAKWLPWPGLTWLNGLVWGCLKVRYAVFWFVRVFGLAWGLWAA